MRNNLCCFVVTIDITLTYYKIMDEFTHLAEIYGLRCYFNIETNEVKGVSWFNEKIIDIFLWIESTFPINYSFEVTIIEEL